MPIKPLSSSLLEIISLAPVEVDDDVMMHALLCHHYL
jgi:hypothetical protein